jgi:hypothetical protein
VTLVTWKISFKNLFFEAPETTSKKLYEKKGGISQVKPKIALYLMD